jgi:glutathione S-transferase
MITLHHLAYSRSTRVLWALEELGIPYELVVYQRTASFRSPPELAAVHPLGKAPVIVDDGLVVAESGAILTYLNDQHGGGRLAPPIGSKARVIHDEWLHYVEGSAAMPVMLTLIGGMVGGLQENLTAFVQPELVKTMAYIADGVGEGPWLMGEDFTAYLIELAVGARLAADHPGLKTYLFRLQARPAYEKAIALGGPVVPSQPG